MMEELNRQFQVQALNVNVYATKEALGQQAALDAAAFIRETIKKRGTARLLFSAANSQLEMVSQSGCYL